MTRTKGFFNDGAAYDRLMGRWSLVAGGIFLDWLSLPGGLRWLDVGCGTGPFTEQVVQRCAPSAVAGIDPSRPQIDYASDRPGARGAEFRVGDAGALPYSDGAFDVAAMSLAITFVPDAGQALAEMTRVTRPGGTIATYMWDFVGGGFTQQPLRDALEAVGVGRIVQPNAERSTLDGLESLFRAAGLDDVAVHTIDIELSYADFDDYWDSETCMSNNTVRHVLAMSDAEIERLKDVLRERLPTRTDGSIAFPARANAAKGTVRG